MLTYGKSPEKTLVTPVELTQTIRTLTATDDIKIKMNRRKGVDLDTVIVSGLYDPVEDEDGYPSIFLYVSFNPEQEHIDLSTFDWQQLCIDVIECCGHEIVHQEQYRSRDFDIGPTLFLSGCDDDLVREEQEYLGSEDEVEAYGFSIAIEMFLRHGAVDLLGDNILDSATYQLYTGIFGVHHPIVKKLLVNTVKFYKRLVSQGDDDYVKGLC